MAASTDVIRAHAVSAPHQRRSPLRRTLDVASTLFAVLVVMVGAVAAVIAVATHFSKDGEYTVFGHPMLVVLSGSMAPGIRTGDLVIDDPVSAAQASHLHVGQVISFVPVAGGTPITHRIAAVSAASGQVAYVTKGDANGAADSTPVAPSQVTGLFNKAIPRGGYILTALHQPLTLGLLLASPALWLLSGLLFEWARKTDGATAPQPAHSAADSDEGEP